MYPLESRWPAASTPSSADASPPSPAIAHRRRRAITGELVPLVLVVALALTLFGCGTSVARTVGGPPSVIQTTLPTLTPTYLPGRPSNGIQAPTPVGTAPVPPVKPSLHEVSQTASLAGTGVGPTTATCPKGELALSEGWSIFPPAPGAWNDTNQAIRVYAAMINGATAEVYVAHPPLRITQTITVTTYVECLAGAVGAVVTRRAFSPSVPAASANLLPGFCNANEIPVGSGFDLSSSPATLEFQGSEDATFEQGVWWQFHVVNRDSMSHTITIYVRCLSHVSASVSFPASHGPSVAPGTTASFQLACPSGTAVTGGGASYDAGMHGIGTLYLQHAAPNGWQGAAYASTSSVPLTTAVAAVCLSFP